jgi:hypothetical protein
VPVKRAVVVLALLTLPACTTVDTRCSGDGVALAYTQADLCGSGLRLSLDGLCVPNGYCEVGADCGSSDFCLVEWCYSGPECKRANRCTLRVGVGAICEADSWCAEGLRCDLPKDCGGYPCKASTCVEVPPA